MSALEQRLWLSDYNRQRYLKAQEYLLVGEIGSKACDSMVGREPLVQILFASIEQIPEGQTLFPNKIFLGQVI